MKVLVLDIVHDLRVKRLWPVAAALLVALIAVPMILMRGSNPSEVPAPEPVAQAPSPLETSIKLTDKPEGGSSDLGQFDRHNPFRPAVTPKEAAEAEKAAAQASGDGSGSDEGSQPSPPPATDTSTGGTTPSGGGSEATPPGKSPAGGGGGSSKSSKKSDDTVETTPAGNDSGKDKDSSGKDSTEVRLLSYNAETVYGPAGHASRHTVEPNEVFPGGKRYFMYSGVSKDGKDAIFTVLDPSLVADRGAGHCVQVSGRCAVLHLRDGQERRFENEKGEGFVIRLGALDPVKKLVDELSGKLRDTVDKLLDPLKQ